MNKFETMSQDNLEQEKNQLISQLGSSLHEEWRAPRKKEDGSFEPRWKSTNDKNWIAEHNTNEVDIANTVYDDLPSDWKGENEISAKVAIGEIYEAINNNQELDDNFIENASDVMHEKWLERNGSWAPAEQNKPYAELSEEEKEKDRVIIKKAIELYQSSK
ncbi:MAG TPA: hypothetical protein PLD95_03835 [bacterium]|jgi:hypothetical protein|nr:hypothetical protein [bacterium]HOG38573.1 hypothetical protein [bacterium]HQI03425.1 hypothetical protein [bacterium]